MRVVVTARHVSLPEAVRAYATEKAARLDRFYDRIQTIEVVFDSDSDGGRLAVELIVTLDRRRQFVAKETEVDVYASVDRALDQMEHQLTRHKKKIRNRKHPDVDPRASESLP